MYVDVKPLVTIVVSMDLHAMGEATIRGGGGLLLHIMLYFGRGYYSRGLLNKGGVYLRKYGILFYVTSMKLSDPFPLMFWETRNL